jgi:DNA invertase Pin-like site-specific DNA recombinase
MSTLAQTQGHSLVRQTEAYKAFAQEYGLTLDTEFKLEDLGLSAFSGDNIDRGALGVFLRAIKEGKIERGSYLLVESLDRLSRQNLKQHMKLFIDILDQDINIATLLDKRIYTKDSDTTDFFISLASMARAHEESKVKSQRGSATWNGKRSRGGILTKRCVAWLKVNDSKTGFELLDDRIDIVKRIFDEAANHGMGADLIARRLNQDEIKTLNVWQVGRMAEILCPKDIK